MGGCLQEPEPLYGGYKSQPWLAAASSGGALSAVSPRINEHRTGIDVKKGGGSRLSFPVREVNREVVNSRSRVVVSTTLVACARTHRSLSVCKLSWIEVAL